VRQARRQLAQFVCDEAGDDVLAHEPPGLGLAKEAGDADQQVLEEDADLPRVAAQHLQVIPHLLDVLEANAPVPVLDAE
jgi:hypothetical protein